MEPESMKGVLRSACSIHGALYVITTGEMKMQLSSANN